MKPFDLEHTPLEGVHLIEAGAGTGKTYTIAGLVLRLIAEQGLGIDQILVVTYTKAATEELKSRIRDRLVSAKAIWSGAAPWDPLVAAINRRGIPPPLALQRVRDALIDFDRAAIYTIHGFCRRVLHHFAFETGHLFDAELVQDALPIVQETADDFWRRYIGRAPAELARYATEQLKGPEAWSALFAYCRHPRLHLIPAENKPPLTGIGAWRRAARQVIQVWPSDRPQVIQLLTSESLNATHYGKCAPGGTKIGQSARMRKVNALVAAMDHWQGDYPVFTQFEKFTQSFVIESTKKNHPTPRHPFFELCDHAFTCHEEMLTQLAAYLRYLKVTFVRQAGRRLNDKKRHRNILFFDDLLTLVSSALKNDRRPELVDAIRVQYRAALVDEFQDTDPLQYDIFSRLFDGRRSLLFMIGDPKQAIYSFRGADLYAYLHARKTARHRHTLTRNWRAAPDLIKALNTLFSSHPRPFAFAQVPYETAVPARSDLDGDGAPFRLWHLTRHDTGGADAVRPITQQAALPWITAAVAEEIVRLLSHRATSLAPEGIAVLTRTHRQALLVKEALARRGVPAVLHSAGRVFDTDEAADLAWILDALADPADPHKVRTALATEMLGTGPAALCAAMEDPGEAWLHRWAQFDADRQDWLRHGFYRMFSRFMAREGIKARLLALPDGERRLTNVLHLSELLHQAAVSQALGPESLIKWLAIQRRAGTMDADAQQLRLESDAHAVRIITIHKSKGLQFDVVFCPFTWAGVKPNDTALVFHDPLEQDRPTLAIGPGITPAHCRQAGEEEMAENLRLLYVALTRARLRCYMVWGCIKGAAISAPAYLLHGTGVVGQDWMEALQKKMGAMTDPQMRAEIDCLAAQAEGAIAVEALPQPGSAIYANPYGRARDLRPRVFQRHMDNRWRVASYSAMAAGVSPETADGPDRDPQQADTGQGQTRQPGYEHLFDFPKGTKAGLFFHDLLEHWDFGSEDGHQRAALVRDKLRAHGFDLLWQHAVDRMLADLGHLRLPAGGDGEILQLADVPARRRVNEMEFYFPLKPIDPEGLSRVFGSCGKPLFAGMPAIPPERLAFTPMHGFLKGYMDTVLYDKGRCYLVDWKSNYLGHAWEAYAPAQLATIMAESHYYLQYHLYVVALDQLLRQRVRHYTYGRHFGGVYYIFLRGIQGGSAATGIFHAVPDEALVDRLREVLLKDNQSL